jgi:hypothetical protein
MKCIKKFVMGSLIVTLISFGGGFCAHPMTAQASEMGAMDMSVHMEEHGTDMIQTVDMATVALSACVFDCISKAPQATVSKKTTFDNTIHVSVNVPRADQLELFEYFSNPLDAIGTSPPSPDILSSVMKKE